MKSQMALIRFDEWWKDRQMGDLESKIRELAAAGQFNHLSISKLWEKDDPRFTVTFTPANGMQGMAAANDPVEAALKAIGMASLSSVRASPKRAERANRGNQSPGGNKGERSAADLTHQTTAVVDKRVSPVNLMDQFNKEEPSE